MTCQVKYTAYEDAINIFIVRSCYRYFRSHYYYYFLKFSNNSGHRKNNLEFGPLVCLQIIRRSVSFLLSLGKMELKSLR